MAKRKFHIEKHDLIPKHAVASEKEKKALFEKYQVTIKELPKMMKNDPAIRSLGAKVGDLIKITRNSSTAGESVYYRGVINE
jgi:DNA-directed RNA polymerase subunit H